MNEGNLGVLPHGLPAYETVMLIILGTLANNILTWKEHHFRLQSRPSWAEPKPFPDHLLLPDLVLSNE